MTSGNRSVPEQGSWQVPGATNAYQPVEEAPRGDSRGRPALVALIVALTELVVIAVGCNQAVSKHARHYLFDHLDTFLGRAVGSSLQFGWRFTPTDNDNRNGFHLLYSQLVLIAVLVVLSALMAAVVVRGAVTFWRAFLGVWTAVLAATCVARVVGSLVTRSNDRTLDRATSAVFLSINAELVFAGVVLGLLTALVAALFAVSTRRAVDRLAVAAAPPEPVHQPEAPPPFYGTPQPAQQSQPSRQPQPDQRQYGQQAQPEETDGRTTQIPRFDPRGGTQWTPPQHGDQDAQRTQALPADSGDSSTQALPTTGPDAPGAPDTPDRGGR